MRRLALIGVLLAAGVAAVVAGAGAGGKQRGTYKLAAIFDNAGSLIPSEQVKVAGVVVGTVDKMSLTPDRRHARVEMTVTRPGIGPFRGNAECSIRPQSLIGERFVECQPGTVDRPVLAARKGELPLVVLEHTHSTVDPDLVNNIMRLPYRDRLRLIINEFGVGLAGNGEALNRAIRRAAPALDQTNRLFEVLAGQNRTLRQLVADSDAVFKPWAARRAQVADFIVKANRVQQAVAARRGDLERSFERLPALLRQLRPTLKELGALSDEMTPVMVDVNRAAPDLSRALVGLGPFSRAATPALESLGEASDVGRPALRAFEPVARQVKTLAASTKPFSATLAELLQDLNDTGAFEQFVTSVFNSSALVNAFDSYGHIARTRLIGNACAQYEDTQAGANTKASACNAHIDKTGPKKKSTGDKSETQASNAAALDYLLER